MLTRTDDVEATSRPQLEIVKHRHVVRVPNPRQNIIEALKRIAGWDEMSDSGKGFAGTRPGLGIEVHGIGKLLWACAPFPDNPAQGLHDDWYGRLFTRCHRLCSQNTRWKAGNKGEIGNKAHGEMPSRLAGLDEMLFGADRPFEIA